jgi:hypothetical protein
MIYLNKKHYLYFDGILKVKFKFFFILEIDRIHKKTDSLNHKSTYKSFKSRFEIVLK